MGKRLNIIHIDIDPEHIDNCVDVTKNHLTHSENKIIGTGIYDTRIRKIESKNRCLCGVSSLNEGEICPECGRMVRKPISFFYLPTKVLHNMTDIEKVEKKDRADVIGFLEYTKYIVLSITEEGEVEHEIKDYDPKTSYEDPETEILFGANAVSYIFDDKYKDFVKKYFVNNQNMIAYKYREPMVDKLGKVINNPLNKLYVDLIEDCNNFKEIKKIITDDFTRLSLCNKFYGIYKTFCNNFINILYVGKTSVIKKNVVTQKIGGAIRAVIVPCPGIAEDNIAFSTRFADVLFPQFKGLWKNAKELNEMISWGHFQLPSYTYYHKHDHVKQDYKTKEQVLVKKDGFLYPWEDGFSYSNWCDYKKNSIQDIKNIIQSLADPSKPYYVDINRPPTICQLSFQGLKPIFFDNIGRGAYARNFDKVGDDFIDSVMNDDGSQNVGAYDGENPLSIVMGLHPIICSGMNADFDGDALFAMSIFNFDKEGKNQEFLASKNFRTISNGSVRNGLEEMHRYYLPYIYSKEDTADKATQIHELINKLYDESLN